MSGYLIPAMTLLMLFALILIGCVGMAASSILIIRQILEILLLTIPKGAAPEAR